MWALPTVLFSQPFSGHGWMYFPQWHKQGKKVILLPTSDWKEIERATGLLRVPAWLKQSRIISWGAPQGTAAACSAEEIKKRLGAELVSVSNDRVQQMMKDIDPKAAEAEAEEYWLARPRRLSNPRGRRSSNRPALYLAIKELMIEEKAQAITSSHCMGNPRGCLTFSKLNDLGFVGACEGDMDSTLTMLIFAYAFRAPGFISDPVIDKAKNAMVHFHCTCATKWTAPRASVCRSHPHADRQQRRCGPGSGEPRWPARHLRQTREPGHHAADARARSSRPAPVPWPAGPSSPKAFPTPAGCS